MCGEGHGDVMVAFGADPKIRCVFIGQRRGRPEAGITRASVNRVLKASAVAVGIAGGDVASHSCRITGLNRLLSQGMDFQLARCVDRCTREHDDGAVTALAC